MIKYQLKCPVNHEFEGWFRNSGDYDEQAENGLLECPVCGSEDVVKAIMAPAIAKKRSSADGAAGPIPSDPARRAEIRKDIMAAAERARAYVEKNFDYVGDNFPEEARKIHYGETEERGIYGEATGKDVEDLIEEGVSVAPLPQQKKPLEVVKKEATKKLN